MVWPEIVRESAGTVTLFHAAFPTGSLPASDGAVYVDILDAHRITHGRTYHRLALILFGYVCWSGAKVSRGSKHAWNGFSSS